jgi:hypothetical protein
VNGAPDGEGTSVPTETPTTIGPDGGRVSSSTSGDEELTDEPSTTAEPTPTESDERAAVPLPLPLMPPITLPSLVPGGQGITIGG